MRKGAQATIYKKRVQKSLGMLNMFIRGWRQSEGLHGRRPGEGGPGEATCLGKTFGRADVRLLVGGVCRCVKSVKSVCVCVCVEVL